MAHSTGFRPWVTVGVGTTVLAAARAIPSLLGAQGAAATPVFTKDVAETKATRATDFARSKGFPLMFTTEPEE